MQVNPVNPISEFNQAFQQNFEKPKEAKTELPKTEKSETDVERNKNLEQLKDVLAEKKISLQFSQDSETKQLVVKLVDEAGEAIRQIPSDISLKLAAVFVKMKGQFVDTKE